ncbi:MAG: oligosaccharide flippase family protein [Halioglobus sp.]
MNTRQNLARSLLGLGGIFIIAKPIMLLISIVLARGLGPSGFGQYTFALACLALIALPSVGGISLLLTRETARFSHAGQWRLFNGIVSAAHGWVFVTWLLIFCGYYLLESFDDLMPAEGKWALLGVIIWLLPLQGFIVVRVGTIKGLGFPALAESPSGVIQPLIFLILIAILAALDLLTPSTALWALIGVTGLTYAMTTVIYRRVRPSSALSSEPEYRCSSWLRALFPFTLISLVITLGTQLGVLLLGTLGTDEAVGALQVADRGAQLVALPLSLVNVVMAPQVVHFWHSKKISKLQIFSRQTARIASALSLPVAVVLIVFGELLIELAFGADFVQASYPALVVLVLGHIFGVMIGSPGILLAMSGHEKLTLLGQISGLLVTVIASVILIPEYQALGVAIALVLGLTTSNFLLAVAVIKHLKIRPGIL